jgi:hypothetical protein
MKYRKKPLVIEATQWFKNGDHPEDDVLRRWEDTQEVPKEPREGKVVRYFRHPEKPGTQSCEHCALILHDHGWIDTKEGGHIVCPSDWIITGIAGEYYPCKDSIFRNSYDKVETE